MLTARSSSGATVSETGSLITKDPVGILTEPEPLNVTTRSVSGFIPAPAPRFATWAAPMTRSPVPAALDSRTRIISPPMLMRGNMRIVGLLSATPSAGAGVAVHVPTQCVMPLPPRCQTRRRTLGWRQVPWVDGRAHKAPIIARQTERDSSHAPHVVPPDALHRATG